MLDQLFRGEKYTADELNARLKFFIGMILGLTLFGIVFVVLYSLIFVTQPMNGMSPVDNKFFELIIPIATFLTGTLSGIMLAGGDKDAQMKALEAATRAPTPPASPSGMPSLGGTFGGPKPLGGGTPSFGPSLGGMGAAAGLGAAGGMAAANAFSPAKSEPTLGFNSAPVDSTFAINTAGSFSSGDPVMRNGKLGPPQEEHPVI